jgi:hypothetical protein
LAAEQLLARLQACSIAGLLLSGFGNLAPAPIADATLKDSESEDSGHMDAASLFVRRVS